MGDDGAPWHVYLLECGDGSLYCGVAKDVDRRVAEHAAGRGARYTRGRGPFRLRYVEGCETHGDALRRELAIKRMHRRQKLALTRARAPD